MSLEVTTALHCTKKQLQGLSGLTFLVDENWVPSNDEYTLPIAFFHMLSCKEHMQSEVSEKRIILYQSKLEQGRASEAPVKQSVLEVIADNRINKPKTYTCEILIPYGDLNTIFNHTFSAMNNALTFLETNADAPVKVTIQALYASLKTFTSILNLLLAFYPNQKLENFLGLTGAASFGFNSKSLEKMRNESAFCLFKSWDSWDTKRVSIKNLTFDKKGTEDMFIRGTLELVETPIYTIGAKGSGSLKKIRAPNALEQALKTGISGFIEFYKEP